MQTDIENTEKPSNSAQGSGQDQDYLNNIKAGNVYQDKVGDRWKVVGQHGDSICCCDEPIDQDPDLPYISLWSKESFSEMELITGPATVSAETH
jgi:hypothetical protein